MRKYMMLLGIVLLMNLVGAVNLTAGENYTFQVNTTEELFWDVVGNSSNMDGFIVHQDGFNITFEIDQLFRPDSFTIILFEEKTVIKEVRVGGGGTKTVTKTEIKTVPKYITKYEEVIKEIEVPTEVIVEVPQDHRFREHIFMVISLILIFVLVMALISRMNKLKNTTLNS